MFSSEVDFRSINEHFNSYKTGKSCLERKAFPTETMGSLSKPRRNGNENVAKQRFNEQK